MNDRVSDTPANASLVEFQSLVFIPRRNRRAFQLTETAQFSSHTSFDVLQHTKTTIPTRSSTKQEQQRFARSFSTLHAFTDEICSQKNLHLHSKFFSYHNFVHSPGCDVVRSGETWALGFPRGSGAVPPNSRSPGIGIHKVIVTPR